MFERGRVRTESVLKDSVVDARITDEDFDPSESWIKRSEHMRAYAHPYDVAFRGIMRNFANAILGNEPNYLTPEDLLRNTVAANALKGCGTYDSQSLPKL